MIANAGRAIRFNPLMKATDMKIVMAIAAEVSEDLNQNRPTDIYRLADGFRRDNPELCPVELVTIVELAVIAVGGAALWSRVNHDA